MKIKVGDEVLISNGRDKGKKGKVELVLPKKDQVVVAGINIVKRHAKASAKVAKGGIIDLTKPLQVSRVQVVCPNCHLPTRVGLDTKDKGKRICKKCSTVF